jgi:starch phosphorylase
MPASSTASPREKENKVDLAHFVRDTEGILLDPDAMFDIQIKRIHEYKRQHLNILETIALWHAMRENPNADWTPRVKIFAGKAAPGYVFAKKIIHLINDVARTVNSDPVTSKMLKVAYLPNYNVTLAERLIPAADLSEQISTAGKEASGTGNMKFALNGALTIGTLDGANVEIREHVGADNFFLFGMTAPEVVARRAVAEHAKKAIDASPHLAEAIAAIESGAFSPGEPDRYADVADNLRWSDYFLVCSDFAAYYDKQREVDHVFRIKNLDAHGGIQHRAHRLVLVGPHHSRLHERCLVGAFGDVLIGSRAMWMLLAIAIPRQRIA